MGCIDSRRISVRVEDLICLNLNAFCCNSFCMIYAEWSGETIVQKYLESLAKDELYSEIKSAACFLPSEENDVLKEALDAAMTEFGRGVISTVGAEIDRLEGELQSICPGLIYVDLETERGK